MMRSPHRRFARGGKEANYHRLDKTWALLRDFNNYPVYIEGVTDSVIEDARRDDEVGAVRRFCYGGVWLRQRLEAHSGDRS